MNPQESKVFECSNPYCLIQVEIKVEPFVRHQVTKELIGEKSIDFCPSCGKSTLKEFIDPLNKI